MSLQLTDKSIMELPTEIINLIIGYLPKHPIAIQLTNISKNLFWGDCFHKMYFRNMKEAKWLYEKEMEIALLMYTNHVSFAKGRKKYMMEDGVDSSTAKQMYHDKSECLSYNEELESDSDSVCDY